MFASFGIAHTVVTDNDPHFASTEFAVFAEIWMVLDNGDRQIGEEQRRVSTRPP